MPRRRHPPGERVTLEEYRVLRDKAMTEDEWLQCVVDEAEALGYQVYHTHDSRRSQSGYPDLCMVHRAKRRLIYVELKIEGGGRLTPEQYAWLDDLRMVRGVEVYIWWPSDRAEAVRIMSGPMP